MASNAVFYFLVIINLSKLKFSLANRFIVSVPFSNRDKYERNALNKEWDISSWKPTDICMAGWKELPYNSKHKHHSAVTNWEEPHMNTTQNTKHLNITVLLPTEKRWTWHEYNSKHKHHSAVTNWEEPDMNTTQNTKHLNITVLLPTEKRDMNIMKFLFTFPRIFSTTVLVINGISRPTQKPQQL